jgi:phosphoribosylanthranilate isomerase
VSVVKICGITRPEDAEAAARFGASYIGFVLWPKSPRAATLDIVRQIVPALPEGVTAVGVFVDPTAQQINDAADAGIRIAQVHGSAAADLSTVKIPVIRAVHLAADRADGIVPDVEDELILLDAYDPVKHGGTGKTVDWKRAQAVAKTRRVILAGGLTPFNVRSAIEEVRPYAVDVASGVESSPGIKDHGLLRAFIAAAKAAETSEATESTESTESTDD